ncbi:MAG: deoxyguanosinetriphosphate triphosphohydrolase [Nitrospiraceae bacterium]|nr:MAG: deoxyguanosinetriphosphate triphosphohydrolase [Nitrospiraceae bacterium]
MQKMDWRKLLSKKRLGRTEYKEKPSRPVFQIDFDRIIFSSAFRRLQDKTQVFPLAESDYVRTRLTHSLETSCIGRSLGTIIGKYIIEKHALNDVHASDFGTIVATACLAHDIGNPPLGHSGEDAIRHWFKHSASGRKLVNRLSKAQKADLMNFEGNAQGFRVLSRLQYPDNIGGMQLTCATLGAYTKYPRESYMGESIIKDKSVKKWGFFQNDKDLFKEVANEVGLIPKSTKYARWCRHPLAYLVEAADDVTYTVIDFEDGYRVGYITYDIVHDYLSSIINNSEVEDKLKEISGEKEKIEYLRAKAINKLITEVSDSFKRNEDAILQGEFKEALISKIDSKANLNKIIEISQKKVYSSRNVLEIEAAGFGVLGGLLEEFVSAVEDVARKGDRASQKSKKLLSLVPAQFLEEENKPCKELYVRLLQLIDFIAGMTDSYAVSLYKKISGISIPRG